MDANQATAHCQAQNASPTVVNKFCDYTISYKAKAGTVLGTAGGTQEAAVGFDFGGWDTRTAPLAYIDQALKTNEMADQIFHTICTLDYFPKDIKTGHYAKIGRSGVKRTIEPLCGSVMQDKVDTIQGNWFVQGSDYGDWTSNLAIVHDIIDPNVGIFSVGGTVTNAGLFHFQPTSSGSTNLEPSTTSLNTLYCYSSSGAMAGGNLKGQMLVELTDATTMKVENQPGNCTGNHSFTKPVIYSRTTQVRNLSPGSVQPSPPGMAH